MGLNVAPSRFLALTMEVYLEFLVTISIDAVILHTREGIVKQIFPIAIKPQTI